MFAIKDLEDRRVRLSDELEKLDQVIGAVRAYATAYAPDMLGGSQSKRESKAGGLLRVIHSAAEQAAVQKNEPTITERTADAAWEAIVEANRPLSLAEISEAVVAARVPLGETDNPRNVIGARLHNSKRFTSTPRGWWLKDEPMPNEQVKEPSGSNENGAHNGYAARAPEAEGIAVPSNESQALMNELLR